MTSFFSTPPSPTAIYTLSLHDALPILTLFFASGIARMLTGQVDDLDEAPIRPVGEQSAFIGGIAAADRKSTRLNSSHGYISYAVFCLKKKKKHNKNTNMNREQYQMTVS